MPAFFKALVADFLSTTESDGLNQLNAGLAGEQLSPPPDQYASWAIEWRDLQKTFANMVEVRPEVKKWGLLLEYSIPGRKRRLDAVLLTPHGITIIEFKSSGEITSGARWQISEYCWNIRDFHAESRGISIGAILAVGGLSEDKIFTSSEYSDRSGLVLGLQICNPAKLSDAIIHVHTCLIAKSLWKFDLDKWDKSQIQPTPSVIEFANRLYEKHEVREIKHSSSDDTDKAINCIKSAIIEARRDRKRVICFVSGVPGAGKTLVGLQVAYQRDMIEAAGGPICFASGNKPLLDVLNTALVRNRSRTNRERRENKHDLSAPVENIHDYVRNRLAVEVVRPPEYNVVVFDEAQRVWNAEKLLDGLNNRRAYKLLNPKHIEYILRDGHSEPELLLSLMERCQDWCVIVALIGGGQEIHTGEAGLAEWGEALLKRKSTWQIWASPESLEGGTGSAGQRLFSNKNHLATNTVQNKNLHLAISKRCIHAEHYAEWVNHIVNGDSASARSVKARIIEFPILLTRDLSKAREAIKNHSQEGLRFGLLASSGALRLRADGIEVSAQFRGGIKYSEWFLCPADDVRSSNHLEVAATEFECQGLELDWSCICWGGDFVMGPGTQNWQYQRFRPYGSSSPKWHIEKDPAVRDFIKNKYRVLLTRSRMGVILFVPRGSDDLTRPKEVFDATAEFLIQSGAQLYT